MSVRRTLSDHCCASAWSERWTVLRLERGMATENPESPGYHSALAAIAAAKVAIRGAVGRLAAAAAHDGTALTAGQALCRPRRGPAAGERPAQTPSACSVGTTFS